MIESGLLVVASLVFAGAANASPPSTEPTTAPWHVIIAEVPAAEVPASADGLKHRLKLAGVGGLPLPCDGTPPGCPPPPYPSVAQLDWPVLPVAEPESERIKAILAATVGSSTDARNWSTVALGEPRVCDDDDCDNHYYRARRSSPGSEIVKAMLAAALEPSGDLCRRCFEGTGDPRQCAVIRCLPFYDDPYRVAAKDEDEEGGTCEEVFTQR